MRKMYKNCIVMMQLIWYRRIDIEHAIVEIFCSSLVNAPNREITERTHSTKSSRQTSLVKLLKDLKRQSYGGYCWEVNIKEHRDTCKEEKLQRFNEISVQK